MRAAVPFLLLSIPLIEIALFVVVGDAIGLWATLGATVATAVVGVLLIRGQGVAAVRRLRPGASGEAIPLAAVVRGAVMVMAGMLLLIPGFLTDLLALSLLLPPVRRRLGAAVGARFRPAAAGPGFAQPGYDGGFGRGPVIDGDAVVVRDAPTQDRPSAGSLRPPGRHNDDS